MYEFLKPFHSIWALLAIISVIFFTVVALFYAVNKKSKDQFITKTGFITTMIVHIQFVFGIVLYFLSPITTTGIKDMGASMKDSAMRLYVVEHPLIMILCVVLITIANSKLKRSNTVTFKIFIFGLLTSILILSRIPWNAWLGSF